MKKMLAGIALAAAAWTAPAQAQAQARAPLYSWVQMGPEDTWIVRQVHPGSAARCPDSLRVRARPDSLFPVLVCERVMPMARRGLRVDGRWYPRPELDRGAVVILGDTGCRMKGADQQRCDVTGGTVEEWRGAENPWPFPVLAQRVAARRPAVVAHTGDYLYREGCPAGVASCGPIGDRWETWEADFFRPARLLLEASPWVFSRGNHEDCQRAGVGFHRFLAPGPVPADSLGGCARYSDPYLVKVADRVHLLILDSACAPFYGSCEKDRSLAVRRYARQVERMHQLASGSRLTWILTHTPIWAVDRPGSPDEAGTTTLQEAIRASRPGALPPSTALVAAGHIHGFEIMDFAGGRPVSMVVGNGGVKLDDPQPAPPAGRRIDGAAVGRYLGMSAFGWAVMTESGDGWQMLLERLDEGAPTACRLVSTTIRCSGTSVRARVSN